MNKLKNWVLFLLIVLAGALMCLGNVSNAQETDQIPLLEDDDEIIDNEGIEIIATVNVFNPQAEELGDNKFKVSFDLSNEEGVQPDMRYGVNLTRWDEETGVYIVDSKVYDETIYLGENQTVQREVEYSAPSFINGIYHLEVEVRNSGGLLLGLMDMGEFNLTGSGEYVEILQQTCKLRISGVEEIFDIDMGIDVDSTEDLFLVCTLENHFGMDASLVPIFDVFYRSKFGENVSKEERSTQIVLAPGEKKEVELKLPRQGKPQAYDVLLSFREKNNIVSNKVSVHYVEIGASASIQNLILDKNSYNAGETAKASFVWSGSADSFPEARHQDGTLLAGTKVEIVLKDGSGRECSKVISQEIDPGDVKIDISIPIDRDCPEVSSEVNIKDGDGNILDGKELSFVEKEKPLVPEPREVATRSNIILVLIVIFILIAVIGLVGVIVKWPKGAKVLVFLIGLSIILLSADSAHAYTASYKMRKGSCNGSVDNTWTFYLYYNLNKSRYHKRETITTSGAMGSMSCNNIPRSYRYLQSRIRNVTGFGTIWSTGNRDVAPSGSRNITAPRSTGSYTVRFKHHNDFDHNNSYKCREFTRDIGFSVYNSTPTAYIDSPANNSEHLSMQNITFTGHGTDNDGDSLSHYWYDSSNCSGSRRSSSSSYTTRKPVGSHHVSYRVHDGTVYSSCRNVRVTVRDPRCYYPTNTAGNKDRPPSNYAEVCSGDLTGLTGGDIKSVLKGSYSSSCTATKCEYYCQQYYVKDGANCREAKCVGTEEPFSSYCPSVNGPESTNLIADTNWSFVKTVDNCTFDDKCEKYCKDPDYYNPAVDGCSRNAECHADMKDSCSEPDPTKLCKYHYGIPDPPTVTLENNLVWKWTCVGRNGGDNVDCQVEKRCPWEEVQP